MTVRGRSIPLPALTWFGLLGAPVAWVGQFLVGFGASLAACGAAGRHWVEPVDGWTLAGTIVAATIAALGEAAAVTAFVATRRARGTGGDSGAQPLRRLHFLAAVGR